MDKNKKLSPYPEAKASLQGTNFQSKRIKMTKTRTKKQQFKTFLAYFIAFQVATTGTIMLLNAQNEPVVIEKPIIITKTLNDLEPSKEQVKQEIIKQSQLFGVDTQRALALAQCESNFVYNAKNPNSTARGVYQYLIGTWEETESAKQGLERNNYKANIREAMLDLANGQADKWNDGCKF